MQQVMAQSDAVTQTASDFQERYVLEKTGNQVNPFSDPKKERDYQKFKGMMLQ